MIKKLVLSTAILLAAVSPSIADDIKIGAGAAPSENVLKPIKSAFEIATKHTLSVISNGPKQAFIDLERGSVDAAAAGLSYDAWIALLKKEKVDVSNAAAFQKVVIGKDKVIVIVHKDNPVQKLTKEQLTGIFTGKITNWKDVGAKDAPILVVWGGLTQGTNSMFVNNIMDGAKPTTEVIAATTATDIRQNVATNPEAIGIGPQAILDSTIRSPETPELARPITLLTKGTPSAKVQKVIDFIKTEGSKYIK